MQEKIAALGVDLGSTTVKYVLLNAQGEILAQRYERHGSSVMPKLEQLLKQLEAQKLVDRVVLCLSGSGALGLAQMLNVPFEQEVVAAGEFLRQQPCAIDACVELGGEDAKILYLTNGVELRMNEACAGGTGAFIDQAAALLKTDAAGLDALAQKATRTYPVASRCGVFAKTDFINLLNNGIPKSDIAQSIFEAVAEQAVSGLSCGRPLTGNIAFLGGPLSLLPQLRQAFCRRIGSEHTHFCDLPLAQYAVAYGAALKALTQLKQARAGCMAMQLGQLAQSIHQAAQTMPQTAPLPALFDDCQQYQAFKKRHEAHQVATTSLSNVSGALYLGVDLGSTTVKAALMSENGQLCQTWYENNDGEPLEKILQFLKALLDRLPETTYLRSICTTGYGAAMAKSALAAQFSEVETLAHQRAAREFDPKTSFVIDIGGQDMKCLKVQEGRIVAVTLNEACSSGCGAFLQTFARQMNMTQEAFVQAALRSKRPCDLGSRCTVFMNSKVRQAQREGASLEDIAAGLCVSIVRNALHKVLHLKSTSDLGEHVVVQGGTFLNDAVLRVFEMQTGIEVIRPDLAGLMGAYGAALLARDRTKEDTALWNSENVAFNLDEARVTHYRCKGCSNHCELTMHRFASGQKFVSGNRCDFALKASVSAAQRSKGFVEAKLEKLFAIEPLAPEAAPNGTIGIARVLNMYEHYPYWAALFKSLGFSVRLSPFSAQSMLKDATDTIPSQSLCLPAKLAHGHIGWLASQGVDRIWMPCVTREAKLFKENDDTYACPVVGGYPEALKLNLQKSYPNLTVMTPFLRVDLPDTVAAALKANFPNLSSGQIRRAIGQAQAALNAYRNELITKAQELWDSDRPLVVLASHPYHLDPFVHHGIANLIESMGYELITEDALALIGEAPSHLEVVNQWAFHARLYRAAHMCVKRKNTELIQLVSFGCGIDAITSEQVKRIMQAQGKLYTMLKIDETDSLGSARIRLASHFSAVKDRENLARSQVKPKKVIALQVDRGPHLSCTEIQKRTLYMPQMAPVHFPLLASALASCGYRVQLLPTVSDRAIDYGLRYVNNDACYPAIVVIGQLLEKLHEPDFKPQESALLLAQTCGPCRASNYTSLLNWALKESGFSQVPIFALSTRSITDTVNQLKLSLNDIRQLLHALLFGDLLQRLTLHCRAYEKTPGESEKKLAHWQERLTRGIKDKTIRFDESTVEALVKDFSQIERTTESKPRVGIVGEILLKYHPKANLQIVDKIFDEGAEPVLGDISSFVLYCLYDHCWQAKYLQGKLSYAFLAYPVIQFLQWRRKMMGRVLERYHLGSVLPLSHLLENVQGIVSPGQEAGEGWLLTAEMIEFIHSDVPNVLCLQPFGCLPNHITGKGVMRALRIRYPQANLCAMDFEAGTSDTNVANRLKLFLSQTLCR